MKTILVQENMVVNAPVNKPLTASKRQPRSYFETTNSFYRLNFIFGETIL